MKVLVALATWNRPVITGVCLDNLTAFRSQDVKLVVYDDASTAYGRDDLARYADEVVRFKPNGGIPRSRARAVRDFVYRFREFDLLYLTDNDTVHDPQALDVLRDLFAGQAGNAQPLPVSLFNSVFHNRPENLVADHPALHITRSIAGVSHGYDRKIATTLANARNYYPDLDFAPGWDWNYVKVLARPCVMTRTSYLEHFARDRTEGGLHNPIDPDEDPRAAFERDRAVNPTSWLAGVREQVIAKILG
jgi:hypothetical protein